MRHLIIVTMFLFHLSIGYGQKQINEIKIDSTNQQVLDSVLSIQKRIHNFLGDKVSIYEFGDTLINCETNFKNLFNNWSTKHISNANNYKLIEYSLIDVISDSTVYNSYKNHFSSDKPIGAITDKSREVGTKGQVIKEFNIYPELKHSYLYAQKDAPENIKAIFSKDFLEKAQKLLKKPFSIDTMKLKRYTSLSYNKNTTIEKGSLNSNRKSEGYSVWNIISYDSITTDYIDIFIKNKKQIDEIKISEAKKLILQDVMIKRISEQMFFTQQVKMGDKVYLIKFEYEGMPYSNYVVCSSSTHRVVIGSFFQRIEISEDNK